MTMQLGRRSRPSCEGPPLSVRKCMLPAIRGSALKKSGMTFGGPDRPPPTVVIRARHRHIPVARARADGSRRPYVRAPHDVMR
jgi:hypothetical protein